MKTTLRLPDGSIVDMSDFEGAFNFDNVALKYGETVARQICDDIANRMLAGSIPLTGPGVK